jgi:hypothetical protein
LIAKLCANGVKINEEIALFELANYV